MANDKPLIPLEYCNPERAARLLGCEVEDIFHWAAVGAITLYAEFYDHEINSGISDGFMTAEIFIDETVPSYKVRHSDYHELSKLAEEAIKPQKINGLSGLTYITSLRERIFDTSPPDEHCTAVDYGPKNFRFGTQFYLQQPNDGVWARQVYLSGLWAIDRSNVFRVQIPELLGADMGWDITTTYIGGQDPDPVGIELLGVVISNMEQRFRIVREDLQKIQQHMLTGELMSKNVTVQHDKRTRASTATNTPHPSAERYAINREKVLAAAIYAREQWPDECKDATAWAAVLVDHSLALFNTKEPPISQEQMFRQLREALKVGQPLRKS